MKQHLPFIALALGLSACAQTLSSPYSPQTSASLQGKVAVDAFTYTPKQKVEPDEIYEKAWGRVKLTEPVATYATSAIRRELKQAGLQDVGAACHLSGQIEELSIDSDGYSSDYASQLHYRLADGKNMTIFERSLDHKFNASKFVGGQTMMNNVNQVLSININKLLEDGEFKRAVAGSCS